MKGLVKQGILIKEIVLKHDNEVSAVKEILEKGLAVSSSQARRYYYLMTSIKRS